LAVTGHWIDDHWDLQELTLGFEKITGRHTAEALLQAFINVVERFYLQCKVMAITTDNGSNVLRLARLLELHTYGHQQKW
jgi:hypothetical protein